MLRKGIVALMMTVMSVSSLQAADGKNTNSLLDIFKGPSIGRTQHRSTSPRPAGGVTHAVVEDADRQVPEVRQTSGQPSKSALQPAATAPQPTPVPYTPPTTAGVREYQGQTAPVSTQTYNHSQNGDAFQFPQAVNMTPGNQVTPAGWPYAYYPKRDHHILPLEQPFNGHHLINGGYIPGNHGGGGAGSLYPAPRPGIPHQVGGTAIVHQALHPHEMLYAHRYKAMYGPFYHKVDGCWMLTPFGVWSKENWKLQGTTVDVKYKSHISPFALFHPPVIR